MDLVQQLADNIAFQHTDLLAADEKQGLVLAAGNADISVGCLAGAVDNTASCCTRPSTAVSTCTSRCCRNTEAPRPSNGLS